MEPSTEPNPAAPRPTFPTWRIALMALGTVGTTIIASLTGLLTYFFVPPETSQAAFPMYLPANGPFGLTWVGVTAYVAGLLTFFAAPLISSWSDRSKSKFGRRKVFMLWSFIPVAVMSYLLFSPPVNGVSELNVVYLFGVVILLNIFRTMYNVSGALVPELGTTSKIIMTFGTFNAIGWLVGYIVGSQLVFLVKDLLMESGLSALDAFKTTVGSMIAISALLSAVQILAIDENKYGSGISSTVKLFPALKKALTNKTFVLYTLTQQAYFWGDGLFQIGLVYFVTILFGLPDSMMLVFGATMVVIALVTYPLVNYAVKFVTKKTLFTIALLMMVVIMLLFAFSQFIPLDRMTLAWIIVVLSALPNGITGIIPGAITNEIIREDSVRTGEAKEATYGAASGILTLIPAGIPALVAPSLLLLGRSVENDSGVRTLALVASACFFGGFLMLRFFYNEKKLQTSLRAHGYQ